MLKQLIALCFLVGALQGTGSPIVNRIFVTTPHNASIIFEYANTVMPEGQPLTPGKAECLTSQLVVGVGAWHISTPQVSDKTKVRERIAVLIREALKEGEGSVDGIKTWSRVPPSTKTIEEIQAYGDDSVPVLTKFLDSDNERERVVAVDFLGRLGGRRIIIPLRKVIRYDASRSIRLHALGWISLTPWEFASPVVREAMDTDPDPKVREAAKDIFNNHSFE